MELRDLFGLGSPGRFELCTSVIRKPACSCNWFVSEIFILNTSELHNEPNSTVYFSQQVFGCLNIHMVQVINVYVFVYYLFLIADLLVELWYCLVTVVYQYHHPGIDYAKQYRVYIPLLLHNHAKCKIFGIKNIQNGQQILNPKPFGPSGNP